MSAPQNSALQEISRVFFHNFLGHSPHWYKNTIIAFLVVNPFLLLIPEYGTTIAGWCLVLEFIFTLAMALKCYPLQPGGLLAIEGIVIGLATPEQIYLEIEDNLKVILLLVFMVAGIYFMKELLLFTFTKLLVKVRSKVLLSLLFCSVAAVLSAFLDALTVTAVVISVGGGFYHVYTQVSTGELKIDGLERDWHADDLDQFRAFLRSLLMHAAVGTALGGVMTIVGEPQNLLIAGVMEWNFVEFFLRMLPVTLPVFVVGMFTCLALELTKWFQYGRLLPEPVYAVLHAYDAKETAEMTNREKGRLVVQAISALFLVFALGFGLAAVGIIGLTIIVLQSAFNGVIEEKEIGPAFEEALPFTALLCVFFAIVAVIHSQHLFTPVIAYVLSLDAEVQPGMFYIANGLLSAISDNVFVATVYIREIESAYLNQQITREQFDLLGVAINTGTNIPSILTPNGQAAFLFFLTSSLAPLIRLSYGRMVLMALPYFVTIGTMGWLGVHYLL